MRAEVGKVAWVRTFGLNYIDVKNMIKEKNEQVSESSWYFLNLSQRVPVGKCEIKDVPCN